MFGLHNRQGMEYDFVELANNIVHFQNPPLWTHSLVLAISCEQGVGFIFKRLKYHPF